MPNLQEAENKLVKGLLDFLVLQLLNTKPMHGYQIITCIRNSFGIYFGPSTMYPLLGAMQKKGHVISEWNMNGKKPRKVYRLTEEGRKILDFSENSLNLICKKLGAESSASPDLAVEQTRTLC